MTKIERGLYIHGTPSKGEVVTYEEREGKVTRRSLDGSAVWAVFPDTKVERMFTWRRNIGAYRAFPEQVKHGNLTLGRKLVK